MKRLKHLPSAAALALVLALAPGLVSAQEADTLSISGTFHGIHRVISDIVYPGMLGDDLAQVYADGYAQTWTLTLHGIWYSHDYSYTEWNDEFSYGYYEQYITRVHATSFDFQFFGPDADILNEAVSRQLTGGGLTDGAYVELSIGSSFDSYFWWDSGPFANFDLGLWPADPVAGVSFYVTTGGWHWPPFSTDVDGYPIVESGLTTADSSRIKDLRPGNYGGLYSRDDLVDIGSAVPPPPRLSITNGSVWERNKGTTWLNLTVKLFGYAADVVTVSYTTANGTALASSDYTATSGTLTFQPGETSHTISIAIKGDRKREPNETFSVQLSNAGGATIEDAVATATILNDD
ncbi:MAG TPA: Calx-beta domain-containing protein [Pirellulaceae bacterium]|nr:Calx-beta domain-containing protein [Pirellulaceae bacterium]